MMDGMGDMFKENQSVEVVNTNTEHDGKIWKIVGKAPNKAFKLPNGRKHAKPDSNDAWIVQMDAPIHVPITLGDGLWTEQFTNSYGVCDSKYLRVVE